MNSDNFSQNKTIEDEHREHRRELLMMKMISVSVMIVLNLLLMTCPEKMFIISDDFDSLLLRRSLINKGISTNIYVDKEGLRLRHSVHNIHSPLSKRKMLTRYLSKRGMEEQRTLRYDKILINMINQLNILNLPELIYSKSNNKFPVLNSCDVQFNLIVKYKGKTIAKEVTLYDFKSSVSDSKDPDVYGAYMLDNFIDRIISEQFGEELFED